MHSRTLKSLSWTPQALQIDWFEGQPSEFASLWLRDNCPCDRDPGNGQRLIDVSDLPKEPKIRGVSKQDGLLTIEWEDESRCTVFALDWLAQNAPGEPVRPQRHTKLWLEGSQREARKDFAWMGFEEVRDDEPSRIHWLSRLVEDGIAFLTGVPLKEQAVLEPAKLVGIIQETNYGRVFQVRSLSRPENLADSEQGLGLHTDNPYRDPVPGFQLLHVLSASRQGGESLFADGFALVQQLRTNAPELFERLTRTPVPFHFRSHDAELFSEKPLVQLSQRGELQAVHYNNRSVAPLRLAASELGPFYAAYRTLAAMLREERFQLRVRLEEGQLVAFHNHRILHGRAGYSSAHRRLLEGCYLTHDSVLSTAAVLRRKMDSRLEPSP